MRYSVVKANYHHWREMYHQAGDPEGTMVRAVIRAYGYGDYWKKRAEIAETTLELFELDNRDLQDAHRTIGELKQALALVGDYAAYYVTAWEPFEAAGGEGVEPMEFADWLQAQQEVQA
jgi:hypothetical protein